MKTVEIYTTPSCGYCLRAKSLLRSKGVDFLEIDLMQTPEKREEMIARSQGHLTVPQIFINNIWVGGCDDLYALDRDQGLEKLLGGDT